ncbi:MAG: hypothetical protein SGJ19_10585 [Planctomycetia bacterium]|nr:hypothetical protein [Planctomycetia bacterium]
MRRWFIAITLLLVLGGAWYWFRVDPELAKARALQSQLAALGENASWDERRVLMEQMRGQMEQLTDEQRRELFQNMRAPFQERMRAAVDGYFAVPDAQRRAYLDQQIREMEKRRAEMQQRFAQRPPSGENRGPNGGGFPGGGGRGGPPSGDTRDGGRGGAGGGPGGGRERAMLDHSTPTERARSTEYFSAMEKRRKELGLPEAPFGRR